MKASGSMDNGACVEVAYRKAFASAGNGACVEVAFRKSSRSMQNGNCLEVAYRKSSRSGHNGECVEVADGGGCDQVHVRDSKLGDGSPILDFGRPAWTAFLAGVRAGEFET